MIPIWAKDKTGKYQVFPTHLLDYSYNDGRPRISYHNVVLHEKGLYSFEEKWGHLFEDDFGKASYVLKKQVKTE
jgi:hypothetical protein